MTEASFTGFSCLTGMILCRMRQKNMKSTAKLALLALCIASVNVSNAAPSGSAEPAQTAPVAANNQAKPTAKPAQNSVEAQPADPVREAWRDAMSNPSMAIVWGWGRTLIQPSSSRRVESILPAMCTRLAASFTQ